MYKKIAIMQPYFLPYLGYFQLINHSDQFILYGNVTFRKKSFITRNVIMDVNGRQEDITVFVKNASSYSMINDIGLVESDWKRKLAKKIQNTYRRAEFFDEVYPSIKAIVELQTQSLFDYNAASIQEVCNLLGIGSKLVTKHEHLDDIEMSLDSTLALPVSSQRIINICKAVQASVYINPEGGVHLYDKTLFAAEGISLKFFKASLDKVSHRRASNPYVSIIDVLMHHGVDGTKKMLSDGAFF